MAYNDEGHSQADIARRVQVFLITRAAGHDTNPGGEQLHHYWTRGKGLAKWIGSDHQFYTLRDLLVKATKGKVPVDRIGPG